MKVILSLFLMFVSVCSTMAQGYDNQYYIKVASFRSLPMDMDARIQAPVEDQNGEKCALIKVATNVKGLRFESPALGITKQSEMPSLGEVWVYVPAGSKSVSIFHSKCQPVRNYVYSERIESATVYELTLESNLPKDYQFQVDSNDDVIYNDNVFRNVTFTVQPANAQIVLRKMPQQTDDNGKFTTQMPLGKFHYKVSAENYYDYEGTFEIKESDQNLPINVQLQKHRGNINVTSMPTGATVYVNGTEIGRTPLAEPWETEVGNYDVRIVLTNHKTETRNVNVRKDETAQVDVTLSNSGMMSIESTPSGARLYINDKSVGTTPYKEEMISGDYDIKIEKKKYQTFTKRVHLDSSLPEQKFSLVRQYHDANQYYVQLMGQYGGFSSVGVAIGLYKHNVNVEGDFFHESAGETIYWNGIEDDVYPVEESLSSVFNGVKVGYGIILGSRMRITPQLGIGLVNLKGGIMYDGKNITESYAVNTSIGTRLDYAVLSHFGLVLAPEYCFSIMESDTHKRLSAISSKIKGWANGFNLRLGVSVFF